MSPKRRADRARRARFETKERLLALRVPESLYARLDAFCESMRMEVPWVRMTRSDAVRWLLTVQLQQDQKPGGLGFAGDSLAGG